MKAGIVVICDHGRLVEGTDSGHLKSVLNGMGYGTTYVPRCYEGLEDIAGISGVGATVILADPSVHNNGCRQVDLLFLSGLEELCGRTHAKLFLFALAPEGLGRQDVLDKTNHPLIIESIKSYFTEPPS